MGWSGLIPVRHRDGRRIDVDLRVSASFRIGADECFLISARERRQQWAVGQSVLDGFLTRSPVGMAVMDTQLRYVWLNDTLERFGGVPREQRLGRRLSELLPGLQADTIEGLMRKVLETGLPVTDYEYVGWSWADPHRRHAYSTSFFPLVDPDNSITGVCYMVLDVTERWNARQLLSLVSEAGTRIGTTLDVLWTAQELADFAVPRFADFVVVDLLEPVLSTEGHGAWLTDAGPAPAKPVMRRAGMSSVREGCPEAVARVGERVDFVPPPHGAHLLIDGGPVLIPVLDPADELWATEQPARATSMREFGLHSLISVPMRARNTVLGLTTFIRSLNPVSFQPDDVLVAQELVARAALCVDNARRYTREHTAAVTLQRSLLPQALSGGTALSVHVTQLEPETALPAPQACDFDLVLAEEYPGHPDPRLLTELEQDLLDAPLHLALPERVARPAGDDPTEALRTLAEHPWAMEPEGTAARHWAMTLCRDAGFEPDVRFETTDLLLHLYLHLRLVEQRHAAAFLPDLVWSGRPVTVPLRPLPGGRAPPVLAEPGARAGLCPGQGCAGPGSPGPAFIDVRHPLRDRDQPRLVAVTTRAAPSRGTSAWA
jgi:PAS domain S-box-containing protein